MCTFYLGNIERGCVEGGDLEEEVREGQNEKVSRMLSVKSVWMSLWSCPIEVWWNSGSGCDRREPWKLGGD
jgi:hypothetical protein